MRRVWSKRNFVRSHPSQFSKNFRTTNISLQTGGSTTHGSRILSGPHPPPHYINLTHISTLPRSGGWRVAPLSKLEVVRVATHILQRNYRMSQEIKGVVGTLISRCEFHSFTALLHSSVNIPINTYSQLHNICQASWYLTGSVLRICSSRYSASTYWKSRECNITRCKYGMESKLN